MPTSPPAITAIPDFPPLSDRTTYNAKAYAWANAMDNVTAPEIAAVATNVFNNALEAATSATTATTKAAEAVTSANTAYANAVITNADRAVVAADKALVQAIAATAGVASVNGVTGAVVLKTVGGVTLSGAGDIPVSGAAIGDVFTGTQIPTAGTWLPLNSGIYLQSSYTALYAQLGLIADRPSAGGLITQTGPVAPNVAIAFGAGLYVTVAQSTSTAYSSPDGVTWTARSLPSVQTWIDVIFANGIFLAISNGSTAAATSTDGINWTARALPSASPWFNVAFGAGLFVASTSGAGSVSATSPDGITWTARTGLGSVISGSGGLLFGNSRFIAFLTNSTAATSPDGITWTARTLPVFETQTCAVFGNGVFISYNATSFTASVTADGITWTTSVIPTGGLDLLLFGAGFFFTPGGAANDFLYSRDGLFWQRGANVNLAFAMRRAVFANGRFVGIRANGASNSFCRSQVIQSYNTTTQFALPLEAPPLGAKQWIKAL